MTNEELVQLIQDGQAEYIPQLWDQVYLFICSMAKKRLIGEDGSVWQLEDDLVNESYFSFLEAIDGFKQDGGAKFLTYLEFHLRNSFNKVLGVRTQKGRRNPMRYAASLDAPIEGAEDLTLQDMIIDNMSEEDYRFIENDDFWKDVHELLEETILSATSGKIQEAFITMLHENCIFSEACRRIGIPEDKQRSMNSMQTTGLRQIRLQLKGRAWQRCRKIGIDEYLSIGLHGSGLSAYRRNGFTSSTELAALRLVDGEAWYRKIVELMG